MIDNYEFIKICVREEINKIKLLIKLIGNDREFFSTVSEGFRWACERQKLKTIDVILNEYVKNDVKLMKVLIDYDKELHWVPNNQTPEVMYLVESMVQKIKEEDAKKSKARK